MKTKYLIHLLFLAFISFAVVSCSDDNEDTQPGPDITPDELPTEYNDTYTNSILSGNTSVLSLNYSNSILYGKSVDFKLKSEDSATLTLIGVFPTESITTLENIPVTETENGYSFSGAATSAKGITFKYAGSVKEGELSLDVTDVIIPSNPLSGRSFPIVDSKLNTIYTSATEADIYGTASAFLDWRVIGEMGKPENILNLYLGSNQPLDLTAMIQPIVSRLLFMVLQDITFMPDGNIVANYAPLGENIDFMSLLFMDSEVAAGLRGEFTTSPINLCRYFVDGGSVYIQPDLEMILYTVQLNQSRAESRADLDLSAILQLLPFAETWLAEGIKFTLEENDLEIPYVVTSSFYHTGIAMEMIYNYYSDCEYKLLLEQEEIEPLLSLLPALVNLLVGDMDLAITIMGMFEINVGDMINELIEKSPNTCNFRAGLLF